MSAPETLEEALAQLSELRKKADTAESEVVKLKATKEGLLNDLKKKKQIDAFLKVAGIELSDDIDEDAIAQRIAGLRTPAEPEESTPSPIAQGQTPSDAMNEAVKAQFASLRKELDDLRKAKEQVEEERNHERTKRRESKLEQLVTDELAKAECRRPQHLFKLMKENFRLLEDESTVVYGSEQDPVALREDRKSTRLNSSHVSESRMPSSA